MPHANMVEQPQERFECQPPPYQSAPYNHANMMAQMAQQQASNRGFHGPSQQPPPFTPPVQQKGFSISGQGRGRSGRGGRGNRGGRGVGRGGGCGGRNATFNPQNQHQ